MCDSANCGHTGQQAQSHATEVKHGERLCRICGAPLAKKPGPGRWPCVCENCKAIHKRKIWRESKRGKKDKRTRGPVEKRCVVCGSAFIADGVGSGHLVRCPKCKPADGRYYSKKGVVRDGPPCPCGCGRPRRRFGNGRLSKWHNQECARRRYKVATCPVCGVETRVTVGKKGYCAFHQKQIGGLRGGKSSGRISKERAAQRRLKTHINGIRIGSYTKVSISECLWCKKLVLGHGRGYKKYCSSSCSTRHYLSKKTNTDNPVSCPNCGSIYNRIYVPGQTAGRMDCCCVGCKEERDREEKRKHHRIRRARERAAEKSAGPHSFFDPYRVLIRDRWQCQACGIDTPEELRGTYEDNAPELDHIVPLSKGGQHTMDNCQCLCRACNLAKSDQDMDSFMFIRQYRLDKAMAA